MRTKFFLTALLLLGWAGWAKAGTPAHTGRGRLEFGGDFSVQPLKFETGGAFSEDLWVTIISIRPRMGIFVADRLSVEPLLGFILVSESQGGESDNYFFFAPQLRLAYHFDTGKPTVPYVFAGGSIILNSVAGAKEEPVTLMLPDGGVGFKVFAGDKAAFRIEFFYQHQSNAMATKDLDMNGFGIRGGVSLFIK